MASPSPPMNPPPLNGRPISPNGLPSDSDDPRRTMSPAGNRRVNGATQSTMYTPAAKGKAPVRGEDDVDEPRTSGLADSQGMRERPISPEQQAVWSKSPASSGSRAVSPANGIVNDSSYIAQQPNISSVVNGINGRSSPAVTRQNPPGDGFYPPSAPAPAPAPVANGHIRSISRGGGSISNPATDVTRDLRSKDVEIEGLKRQMVWMREALAKASRSGYVYRASDGELDDTLDSKSSDLAFKFKQFRAQMQVSAPALPCSR